MHQNTSRAVIAHLVGISRSVGRSHDPHFLAETIKPIRSTTPPQHSRAIIPPYTSASNQPKWSTQSLSTSTPKTTRSPSRSSPPSSSRPAASTPRTRRPSHGTSCSPPLTDGLSPLLSAMSKRAARSIILRTPTGRLSTLMSFPCWRSLWT